MVIFIDIDDVLLNARALVLPANRRFLQNNNLAVDPHLVVFDPISIEMLNRIADLSRSRFVLSTSWRYSPGIGATLDALQRNGLSAGALHSDPYCPLAGARADGTAGKVRDMENWLDQHPDQHAWVTLDNDPNLAPLLAPRAAVGRGLVIQIDPLVGISARDYSLALQHLGVGRDPDLLPFKAYRPPVAVSVA